MRRKEGTGELLKTKERVVVRTDLPDLPAGTTGKVILPEGFKWIRYWVRFDNGVVRGSLDRKVLARPSEWVELMRRKQLGEDIDAPAAAVAAGGDGPAAAADEGESVMVNGIAVPGHLIARSKARREALGV
jgi:hypothetical protein